VDIGGAAGEDGVHKRSHVGSVESDPSVTGIVQALRAAGYVKFPWGAYAWWANPRAAPWPPPACRKSVYLTISPSTRRRNSPNLYGDEGREKDTSF
jgi:hypothetical protein